MGFRETVKGFLLRRVEQVDTALCRLLGINDANYIDVGRAESPDIEAFRETWKAVCEETRGADPFAEDPENPDIEGMDAGLAVLQDMEAALEEPQEAEPAGELACSVVQPRYPAGFMYLALAQLVLDGEIPVRTFIGWEGNSFRDLPPDVRDSAESYLDANPSFRRQLSDAFRVGDSGWSVLKSGPGADPVSGVPPVSIALTEEQIAALPRPRPKSENPVYRYGAVKPEPYTLDYNLNDVEHQLLLVATRQNSAVPTAEESLEIALKQKQTLEDWYKKSMTNMDAKIDGLKTSIEGWKNPGEMDYEPPQEEEVKSGPKRDARGRFSKG